MNFQTIQNKFNWLHYQGQRDENVTYIFVSRKPVCRLKGYSDILYIGKTEKPIATRYEQETNTNNTPWNTQSTNIRMTHVFKEYGSENYCCYFVNDLNHPGLTPDERRNFLTKLKTWDKNFYLKINGDDTQIPIEKYLLVCYAAEHLEIPPMNNSF